MWMMQGRVRGYLTATITASMSMKLWEGPASRTVDQDRFIAFVKVPNAQH